MSGTISIKYPQEYSNLVKELLSLNNVLIQQTITENGFEEIILNDKDYEKIKESLENLRGILWGQF